ncbi:MAG: hypothetical protein ACFCVA_14450 [Gammaproteobacteria bacterium]
MIVIHEPSSNIKANEDRELEEFIEGWHFDRKSRKLARDMASFFLQSYDHLGVGHRFGSLMTCAPEAAEPLAARGVCGRDAGPPVGIA